MKKTQTKNENISQQVLLEMFDIARNLSSTLDVDTLLKRIGDAAEELTDSEASSIMLLDDDKQHLFFKVATGEKAGVIKKMKVKVGEGIAGTIAEQKKPLVIKDVSKDKRFVGSFDKSSGFVTKAILGVPLMLGNELLGVAEVLNKKNDKEFTAGDEEVLKSLASLASVSITNARFTEDQKNFFIYIVEIIVQAIESREPTLTGHTRRVARLAISIGRALGLEGSDYKNLYYGALLHDIGYLITSSRNPYVEGRYDPEEAHPLLGWEMVHKINILQEASNIVRSHHENFDGSGYPDKLRGDKIPLGAQVVALAEFIDEMHISRASEEKIQELVKSNSGGRFNPKVVDVYLKEIAPLQEAAPGV